MFSISIITHVISYLSNSINFILSVIIGLASPFTAKYFKNNLDQHVKNLNDSQIGDTAEEQVEEFAAYIFGKTQMYIALLVTYTSAFVDISASKGYLAGLLIVLFVLYIVASLIHDSRPVQYPGVYYSFKAKYKIPPTGYVVLAVNLCFLVIIYVIE